MGHSLLIVDDSNIIQSRIERIFSGKKEIEIVGHASNGEEAVTLAKQVRPSLVTMDLTMPKMDGVRCIKELISSYPYIKILVVSALSDIETGLEAVEQGARGFLCKPFTDKELTQALVKVINSKD